MENLQITGMENYPIKWVCNFKGQRAIGICGKTQKIAMFASDERVSRILDDIVIGTDEAQEGYGCEEKEGQYVQLFDDYSFQHIGIVRAYYDDSRAVVGNIQL